MSGLGLGFCLGLGLGFGFGLWLGPIAESTAKPPRSSVHLLSVFYLIQTCVSYIVCSLFSCRTASDRCQSPCVDCVSCQRISFRFRRPSGNVDVTVFCHMYHILCVQGFHVGRLQTVDNLRVLIFCHANRSHFDSGVHLAMST